MPVVIASDNRLVLDHLFSTLKESLGNTIACASSVDEAIQSASQATEPVLVLLDYEMGRAALDLRALRLRLPPSAVVAIYGAPASAAEAMRLLQSGCDGYLPRSMSAPAIICAVQLMMRGERFVPSIALDAHQRAGTSPPTSGPRLSPRQQQILAMVATGASNKNIAKALAVEEVTVKSHIKAIFRKLDVRSRTEAARLAYGERQFAPHVLHARESIAGNHYLRP